MTKLIFIFIISAALIAVRGEGDDKNSTNVSAFPPEPPHSGNDTTPSPPPPTTKPTTPPPTTKPTPPPTTKPTTPPPTTPPPTTPPPTTKPPTPPPTTKPPTPAPVPPKPDKPSEGTWEFNTTNSNVTCIKLHFAIQIVIPYQLKGKNVTYDATVDIPPSAHVSDGTCNGDNGTEYIEIQWMNANKVTDNIKFEFVQNVSAGNYQVKEINVNITPDDVSFPGIEDKSVITLKHESYEFTTSLLKSYKCEKEQILNLTDASNKGRGSIHISHLQMQAFGNVTNNEFYSAIDCEPSNTPDVVPIAVGCALAILVIVVLVAYLIGRKRRQARGYLSM